MELVHQGTSQGKWKILSLVQSEQLQKCSPEEYWLVLLCAHDARKTLAFMKDCWHIRWFCQQIFKNNWNNLH